MDLQIIFAPEQDLNKSLDDDAGAIRCPTRRVKPVMNGIRHMVSRMWINNRQKFTSLQ